MANNPNYLSSSSVLLPMRFVCISSTSDYARVRTSTGSTNGATLPIVGVTQPGTKYTPQPGGSTSGVAAEVGDMVQVFGQGESDVPILLGYQSTSATTSVLAGDFLTSSSCGDGAAVTCPTSYYASGVTNPTMVYYGARALQSGNQGEIIRCQIVQGSVLRTT